jgi:hypothetical protein
MGWSPSQRVLPTVYKTYLLYYIWSLRSDFYYCHTVVGLLTWGALSDKRAGLSFTVAVGLRRRSHFRDHILLSQIWDFPFRRLLRLTGSRWRYSTPPPHEESLEFTNALPFMTAVEPNRKVAASKGSHTALHEYVVTESVYEFPSNRLVFYVFTTFSSSRRQSTSSRDSNQKHYEQ